MGFHHTVQAACALAPVLAAAVGDACTLPRLMAHLKAFTRGTGQPVLLIPGLFASEVSLKPLAGVLRRLGYQVEMWGCGTNWAHHRENMPVILRKISTLHRETGMSVSIIGHSLGGLYAVSAAHACGPESVRSIVTLGSPVNIDPGLIPKRTRQRLAQVTGRSLEEHLADEMLEDVRILPPGIPTTTIATARDVVVGTASCRYQDPAPGSRYTHAVVRGPSHYGMPFHGGPLRVALEMIPYGWHDWQRLDARRHGSCVEVHTF